MSYPAVLLINRAWNLSGIVARGLQTVNGEQGNDGLFLLNELLSFASADVNLIPYFRRYEGVFVQGQEEYYIPNLYNIETMTFTMDNQVRFPMSYSNRDQYFGAGRVNNIQALPFMYHFERELDGMRIFVYYLPMSNWTFQISGKFGLTNVQLQTDLTSVYDDFYIAYLRYALAEYMCNEYDITFPQDKKNKLEELKKKLQSISPPDLTLKKANFISRRRGYNWAHVNISPGYTP